MSIEQDNYWAEQARKKEMADYAGPDRHPYKDDTVLKTDTTDSIESLGQQYGEITSKIEELLIEREQIRQAWQQKHQMHRDMYEAISQRFSQRTGMDQSAESDQGQGHY